jgi:hypothetical protein
MFINMHPFTGGIDCRKSVSQPNILTAASEHDTMLGVQNAG